MTNAINFIQQHGVARAREVVSGAPETSNHYFDGRYFEEWSHNGWVTSINGQWHDCKKPKGKLIDLDDLERLVENVDLVELLGGIEPLKRKIDGKHIGYTHFNINQNGRWSFLDHYCDFIPDSAYHIGMVNKAIADYEAIYSGAES